MRVFVTGASGFVGSAVVNELIAAGHQVLGLARSDAGAEKVAKAGAQVLRGDVNDLPLIQQGAAECDAVIHTAFNHDDFTRFKANCEADRQVITALGDALAGTNRPLLITSGVGLLNYGRPVTEDDVPPGSDVTPRAATEEAAKAAAAKGVDVYIVRLPPTVHGEGDHGFISVVANLAKQHGEAAYVGDGSNRWAAVHRLDAAVLYRLVLELKPTQKVFHVVAEEGIPFKEIVTIIGKGLQLPVVSKTGDDVQAYFGWFAYFAAMGCQTTGEKTRQVLNWRPTGPNLFHDLEAGYYF